MKRFAFIDQDNLKSLGREYALRRVLHSNGLGFSIWEGEMSIHDCCKTCKHNAGVDAEYPCGLRNSIWPHEEKGCIEDYCGASPACTDCYSCIEWQAS